MVADAKKNVIKYYYGFQTEVNLCIMAGSILRQVTTRGRGVSTISQTMVTKAVDGAVTTNKLPSFRFYCLYVPDRYFVETHHASFTAIFSSLLPDFFLFAHKQLLHCSIPWMASSWSSSIKWAWQSNLHSHVTYGSQQPLLNLRNGMLEVGPALQYSDHLIAFVNLWTTARRKEAFSC